MAVHKAACVIRQLVFCARWSIHFMNTGCIYLIKQRQTLLHKSLSCNSSKARVSTQLIRLPLQSVLCTIRSCIPNTQRLFLNTWFHTHTTYWNQKLIMSGAIVCIRLWVSFKHKQKRLHNIRWKHKRKGTGSIYNGVNNGVGGQICEVELDLANEMKMKDLKWKL